MKICIYYYSGAGNTECIAKIIRKIALDHGHFVSCKRITQKSLHKIEENFDILGIGYPIHFREAPSLVADFIARQKGENRKLFSFCTKGMYSGNASRNIQLFAKQKMFRFAGNLELYMPGSDALALIAEKGSLTERILKGVQSRKIRNKIERFLESTYQSPGLQVNNPKWYTFLDSIIVKPLERYFTENYRIFVSRFHVIQESCDQCRLCVENCPNINIRLVADKITFGANCSFCLRCIHRCPHEAIQIRDRTENKVKYRPTVTGTLTIEY